MHELAVTQNILEIALNKAKEVNATRVTRINVVVGELSGAVPDSVQFYFEILRKDTPAAEAVLDCATSPAKLRCRDCGEEFRPDEVPWLCPWCGGVSVEVQSGRDLYVESIEVS
jgi:hydrogenase nickel incorporation protein HypA/HybF